MPRLSKVSITIALNHNGLRRFLVFAEEILDVMIRYGSSRAYHMKELM